MMVFNDERANFQWDVAKRCCFLNSGILAKQRDWIKVSS